MVVKLLHNTPLWVCSTAIRKCWASEGKSDTEFTGVSNSYGLTYELSEEEIITGTRDKELIERIGNKNKHSSTLEHLNYSFDIDGISRACLQELARHRHASLSVKSSRYTLKELKDVHPEELYKFIHCTGNVDVDDAAIETLKDVKALLIQGVSNDVVKYTLPEAYKTSLVWTINARSLQNFLSLRTDKAALKEIRELAHEIFNQLPEEHKYLFVDSVKIYE